VRRQGCHRFTVSARLEEVLLKRKTKVQSWYFDLTTVMKYWARSGPITIRPRFL